jgi:uncharacterized protein YwqG
MQKEMNQLIDHFGLQRLRGAILASVRKCTAFELIEAQETAYSHFGGRACVPANFEWPEYCGRPLDFILQADLTELNCVWASGLLPPNGTLAFFYDLDSQPWGYDPAFRGGYRVAYFGPAQTLEERQVPNEEYELPIRSISFYKSVSVPIAGSRDFEALCERTNLTDSEYDRYWDFSRTVPEIGRPSGCLTTHQFFGHSLNVQGDMQLEAQLVSHGLYCGNAKGYEDPQRATLEQTAGDWQLLLQLDSDDSVDVMWGDSGMLYYWIRSQDLAQQTFGHIWGTMQCG